MALTIRSFQPPDESSVVQLWQNCGLVVPWNDPHRDIARKLSVLPELFLVALQDERIVGSVMAGYDGHRGWINYLAVDPAQRRRGIGRRLMDEAEWLLRALGCPKINLQVRTANGEALGFYNGIGYRQDDVVSMGKRLEADDSPLGRNTPT